MGAVKDRAVTSVVWTSAVILALVGVSAAVYRAANLADATARAEPVRARILDALGVTDPLMAERIREFRRFDAQFGAQPRLTLLHVIPGAVFLAFAPFQFWARLRNRYRGLHRWSGRVLLLAILVATAPALYFGVYAPFGGAGEALVIALVASLLLLAISRAFLAIRRGQVGRHREWMLRAFALSSGIASARLVGAVLDPILAPLRISTVTGLVITIWLGWALTVGAAEWWIVRTRARPQQAAAER
jgi:uncharacterized membrane protein